MDMTTTLNTEMIDILIERWTAQTSELSEEGPRLPVNVLLGEASDVAEVIDAHFNEYTSKGRTIPGLAPFAKAGGISATTSAEMRELQLAASTVESRYYTLVDKAQGTTMEDAEAIIRVLRFALGYVLEDGQHPEGEEQLSRLRERENESRTQDGVALVLDGYRELARQHLAELSQIPDFNPGIIEQAVSTAQGLRQRSADALTGNVAREQRELLALRNRLLTAIADRLREARRVIRYVYRDHPDIVRKATSDYSRSKPRAKRENPAAAGTPTSAGPDGFMSDTSGDQL